MRRRSPITQSIDDGTSERTNERRQRASELATDLWYVRTYTHPDRRIPSSVGSFRHRSIARARACDSLIRTRVDHDRSMTYRIVRNRSSDRSVRTYVRITHEPKRTTNNEAGGRARDKVSWKCIPPNGHFSDGPPPNSHPSKYRIKWVIIITQCTKGFW